MEGVKLERIVFRAKNCVYLAGMEKRTNSVRTGSGGGGRNKREREPPTPSYQPSRSTGVVGGSEIKSAIGTSRKPDVHAGKMGAQRRRKEC